MMAEVENLVLDHLRPMRGQLDRMEHKLEVARIDKTIDLVEGLTSIAMI